VNVYLYSFWQCILYRNPEFITDWQTFNRKIEAINFEQANQGKINHDADYAEQGATKN
jgi:hypothetical protein